MLSVTQSPTYSNKGQNYLYQNILDLFTNNKY